MFVLFINIIPIASGYGWDGINYGDIALNFDKYILNKLFDPYYIGRVFPAVIVRYSILALGFELNLDSIRFGFQIYNILILFFAGYTWVLIARYAKFSNANRWIGFIALFINYPVLNLHFYYPVLTDSTAFLFGLVLIYAYLRKNKITIIIIALLGAFTWTTMFYIACIVFIFMDLEYNIDNEFLTKKIKSSKYVQNLTIFKRG